ncbi:hypothetical protein HYQ46_008898 [Verticillium longisporum]|nr:hypothetical protein HYQ46_008898 [Verticillium longisporum]
MPASAVEPSRRGSPTAGWASPARSRRETLPCPRPTRRRPQTWATPWPPCLPPAWATQHRPTATTMSCSSRTRTAAS